MNLATMALIGALIIINIGTLVGVATVQNKLRRRDHEVISAQRDLERLKTEAHNVAFAKILLRTEQAVGTDLQESISELTDGFTQQLQGPLLRMANQLERGVQQIIDQHLQTLRALQMAAVSQMESDANELLSQYRETLTDLREAAITPAGEFKNIAEQEKATLAEHLRVEMQKQEKNLLAKFDDKLSDVVSSYLTETLGNDIDLGAQGPYLFRMLEEHKDELRQEIANGA